MSQYMQNRPEPRRSPSEACAAYTGHALRRLFAAGACAVVAALSLAVIVVPAADAAPGTVVGGGTEVFSGPGTSFGVIGSLAAGTAVSFSCYATGNGVTGPYGTETAWDRLDSGGFVPDADIFTGSNSPTVPQCSTLGAPVSSFTVRGSHPVVNDGSQDTHASTPNAACSKPKLVADDLLGSTAAAGFGEAGAPYAEDLLLDFLAGRGTEVDFTAGSTVSTDAKSSSEFNNLNNAIQAQLLQLLRAGYSTVVLPSSVVLPPNFETAANRDLQWGFGGTQGLSITGSGSLINGRYVGALNYIIWDSYGFTPQDKFDGIGTQMRYLQTVCGAPQTGAGAHWFLDSISLSVPFNQPASAPAPAPTGYNTGREVAVVSQATGGDSGHTGPANSYPAGPTHAAGSPIYIVCYIDGQSISGPYGTETAWDLGDDGYYYSDAWLWTDSNGPVVPACGLKTVTVVSQATGGDSGHTGPSNAYSAGPTRAAGSNVQIACYVNGQSISGPYGTESIWDLSTDGYYYSDAWLWTDSNGPVVPECP